MFANLELFLQEKEVYRQKVEEIKASAQNPEELSKLLIEAEEHFKGEVRKYLTSAITVINTNFGCQYSIYKVGKDFDVNFQVVETNVRKTRSEVIAEMEEFKKQAVGMDLTNEQITKINLAMEVLLTYSDDATDKVDENKEAFLKEAQVKATSIIEAPTRENNAFEPAPSQEPNFNPYANQPIEVDNGFKNPEYEKKTLVDPFASIYGGANVSPNEIPEATPDFGVPNPPTNMNMNNSLGDAMSIFGPGITTSTSNQSNTMSNPQQNVSQIPVNNNYNNGLNPMSNNVNANVMPTNAVNAPNNFNNVTPTGAIANAAPEKTNETEDSLVLVDELNVPKESACIVSKLLKGILRLPITTLLFLGIILLIFWGMNKANWMGEIEELLGDYLIYAELALSLFIALIASSTVIDSIASKTKYISKHAMASLTIFSGVTYGLTLLMPYLMENVLVDKLDADIIFEVAIYFAYYLALSFFVGTFMWLLSFMRTKKEYLKKRLNIFEILGALANIYTLIIPAVIVGCSWCQVTVVGEKVAFLYDYENFQWIVMIASFVLGLIMILFSKLEEKKL